MEATTDLVHSPAATDKDSTEAAHFVQLHRRLQQLATLTELIAKMESVADQRTACQILADQLQGYLRAEQVVVGLCRQSSITCRPTAISGLPEFNARHQPQVATQAVLQEAIARGELSRWSTTDTGTSGGMLAHRQFATSAGVSAMISGPLRDPGGQLRGAWMVTGNAVRSEHVPGFLRAAEAPVAASLGLIGRSQKGWLLRALVEASLRLRQKKGRALLVAFVLFIVVMCIPVRYRPRCECVVEPVLRRYVAAPFDGPLEKALVQPGDVVEAGQLLARMDGREVRWELAGTRADLHRAGKEHAGHVATHALGPAEVARFEVDRLRKRTELLEHRDQNLEIRSPISGVVVSGDLEDAEGMPLEVGQSLFEIAPLDEMVVEVAIAEEDYAYVRPGMPVRIRLDAFPLQRMEATIERVHPRTEIRDDRNVFIAEVRLVRPGRGLRPGMHGTARISAERYPLGWNLLRRPFTSAVTWLGW